MARPCDTCMNYRKEFDEFRQQFDDIIVIDNTRPEPHFCPMYDNRIPDGIYYNGDTCEFYIDEKEPQHNEMQT